MSTEEWNAAMKSLCCAPVFLVAGLLLHAGCAEVSAPASNEPGSGSAAAPAADRGAPAADTATSTEPATVADIFPPGAGRSAVLDNCGSCHNLACSAIGQRPDARWDALKTSHVEKVSGPDLNVLFDYLKANFSDSKPEPKVPPRFLEGGCTPF